METNQTIPILKNWGIISSFPKRFIDALKTGEPMEFGDRELFLVGVVYGCQDFDDGSLIGTSPILRMRKVGDDLWHAVIRKHSGYLFHPSDVSLETSVVFGMRPVVKHWRFDMDLKGIEDIDDFAFKDVMTRGIVAPSYGTFYPQQETFLVGKIVGDPDYEGNGTIRLPSAIEEITAVDRFYKITLQNGKVFYCEHPSAFSLTLAHEEFFAKG